MKIIRYVVIVAISLLIGSVAGEIALLFIPQGTMWHRLLSRHSWPGFAPVAMNFAVIKLTLGLFIKVNFTALAAVILSSLILLAREMKTG